MHSRWNEVLIDELHYAGVRPHLGIQPSAAASHRRRAEIEKDRLALLSGCAQGRVGVVAELDFHSSSFPTGWSTRRSEEHTSELQSPQ